MKRTLGLAALLLIGTGILSRHGAMAQQSPRVTTAAAGPPNLALVASASTSFVSGDQTLAGLNSGFNPRNSRDASHRAYGNWPHVGTEWVEYDWTQPINTNKIDVYWFADGQGIKLPKASRLKYWNGTDFVLVPDAAGLGVAGNQYNSTTFTPITTAKLRLEFDSLTPAVNFSTGVLQWKVYDAGGSPNFPPLVQAGEERIVVLGGKTFLNGSVRDVKGDSAGTIAWNKISGPGDVAFADAHALATTATFSAMGDYVLNLSAGAGSQVSTAPLHIRVDAPEPAEHMEPVYTKNYTINSAFWNDRIKALIVNWIPHCYGELSNLNLREGGIANFIEAGKKLAGQPAARHVGYPFANAYVYNTVESMCLALMVDPHGDAEIIKAQDAMRTKLNEWIPIILAAQEPDGYLQTRFTLDPRNPEHWGPRTRTEHEGYTAGYFIESAIAHYTMTGGKDLRLYNAAKKLADCWCDNIGPAPKKAWYDGHEEMEQALVRFGRFVNDVEGAGKGRKYVELAKFLLDCRQNGTEYDQTNLPVIQQYQAEGHAVRAVYLYSAMTDIAMETRNLEYQSAVKSIWNDLVNKKYYITGGVGSGETSEGFGRDFSLPNNSAYCESCSGCGELFFQYKMNLAYHDASYADLYEQTLYNAILGDLDLAGNNFTYTNSLDYTSPSDPARKGARYDWHTCPCCVGNFPRTLLYLPTWMYTRGADSLNVNLFVGSTVDVGDIAGTDVQMVQTTDYPWSDKVSIRVNPAAAKEFTLRVRVPNRAVSRLYTQTPQSNGLTSISVNGAAIASPTISDGYAVIKRTWTAGDRIDFVIPMTVQRVKADPRVGADAGRVALRYGPLVYNVESVDQPNVNLALNPTSPLNTEWKAELLGGVTVIKGTFADGSPLTAIPNYARLNRGGRSLVWLKDQ